MFWNRLKTCFTGFVGDWVVKYNRDSTWLLEEPRSLLSAMDNIVYYFLSCNLNACSLTETSLTEIIFNCPKIFQSNSKPLLYKNCVYDSQFINSLETQIFTETHISVLDVISTFIETKLRETKYIHYRKLQVFSISYFQALLFRFRDLNS